jgi:enhancing lycopene biosynthesis protein 2
MIKKAGLILSGIGYEEGTSIWDVCFVLRELEKNSIKPITLIPHESVERKIPGSRRKSAPLRDFTSEARMVVRGDIAFIDEADPKELDMLIVPGGMGQINVLCSLLRDGAEALILPEVRDLIAGIFARDKKIGAIGYGSALVSFVLKSRIEPIITTADDPVVVELLQKIGADVFKIQPHEVIVDQENRIFSTPGTSPKTNLYRSSLGINVMIEEILKSTFKNAEGFSRIEGTDEETP